MRGSCQRNQESKLLRLWRTSYLRRGQPQICNINCGSSAQGQTTFETRVDPTSLLHAAWVRIPAERSKLQLGSWSGKTGEAEALLERSFWDPKGIQVFSILQETQLDSQANQAPNLGDWPQGRCRPAQASLEQPALEGQGKNDPRTLRRLPSKCI